VVFQEDSDEGDMGLDELLEAMMVERISYFLRKLVYCTSVCRSPLYTSCMWSVQAIDLFYNVLYDST
jgi:hypothetical protein